MTGDVDIAVGPMAQAEEHLTLARQQLAARRLDACFEHLIEAERLARFARYVLEAQR